MKIDVLGQAILMVGALLIAFWASGQKWTLAMLILLGIWQVSSAIHLFLVYRYVKRINYLKAVGVLLLSLPIWWYFIGAFSAIPVVGFALWYFFLSVRDLIKVRNLPRSFWDLTF